MFNEFINESETHFYGVDSETEKRAGLSKFYSMPSRFASADTLVRRTKANFLKPELLSTLSDGKVTIKKNSKDSFHILTTTKFDMESIKKILTNFAERFMNLEGPFGVNFSLVKPNDIFVEFDLQKGITFKQ